MSNILKIFAPQSPNEETPGEEKPCLGCLATSATVLTLGGLYLATGLVFRGTVPSRIYATGVRAAGGGVTVFGLYRGREAWDLYQREKKEISGV